MAPPRLTLKQAAASGT